MKTANQETTMISQKLRNVILAELDLEEWEINEDTTATMVPGWDSLSHARIISAVEDAYSIRFSTSEIMRLKTIGDLQALVLSKHRDIKN
jgi:acyl carrier protein